MYGDPSQMSPSKNNIGNRSPQSKLNYPQQDKQIRIPNHILQRRNQLQKLMVEMGEMDRLEEYLRKKLIAVGWKQQLKNYCKDLIRQKGIQRITVQYLMEQLQTRGKHMIPVTIKEDMLSRVRKFLEENSSNK